jgi:hypothetical protein
MNRQYIAYLDRRSHHWSPCSLDENLSPSDQGMKLSDTLIEAVAPGSRDTYPDSLVCTVLQYYDSIVFIWFLYLCNCLLFNEMHVIESLNRSVQLKYWCILETEQAH